MQSCRGKKDQSTNIEANPKRDPKDRFGRSHWYPYYAGFSARFAAEALAGARLGKNSVVADPWNGSGTTTWAANHLGYKAWGGDLNPAMIVVAKAKLLNQANCYSAQTLAGKFISQHVRMNEFDASADPLSAWLDVGVLTEFRRIEKLIQEHVVPITDRGGALRDPSALSEISSFFYLSLFRLARLLIRSHSTSNPTWVRVAKRSEDQHAASLVRAAFLEVLAQLCRPADSDMQNDRGAESKVDLKLASSSALPLADKSVDLILTSPPYCTRIDYGVATSIELAVLGSTSEDTDRLRRALMGTTTVPKNAGRPSSDWGEICLKFLEAVRAHPSQASGTYYYKSHLQYFSGLHESLKEIARVLAPNSQAFIVVQDSQYKEIHNDLAAIVEGMGKELGLRLIGRRDFAKSMSLRAVHPSRNRYGVTATPVESVLRFSTVN